MGRLIAQPCAFELGAPFRTTAIVTGVVQATMLFSAMATPWLLRRLGLGPLRLVALIALPLRGLMAGWGQGFGIVYPVQTLDGIGGGLLGILTPVAVERLLSGTGRFNLGLAAGMTIQGVDASLSNVAASWPVPQKAAGCRIWRARASPAPRR